MSIARACKISVWNVAPGATIAVQCAVYHPSAACDIFHAMREGPMNLRTEGCCASVDDRPWVFVEEAGYRRSLQYVASTKQRIRETRKEQEAVILKMERELIVLREQLKYTSKALLPATTASGWRDILRDNSSGIAPHPHGCGVVNPANHYFNNVAAAAPPGRAARLLHLHLCSGRE